MERAEAEAIYDQGRDAVVRVLLELSAQNERLTAQVDKLSARVARQEERIAGLEREARRSSRNSSKPPSHDPPSASPRRGKDPSGRGQGGQQGHEGHGRELLPASAADEVVEHWPERCTCGHVFSDAEWLPLGEPVRHQVEELPVLSATMTEHRAQRVRCPECGARTRAELPSEVARSAFGPRLQAAVGVLAVKNRVSRRDAAELIEELFGARICAGSVDRILARAGEALAEPYEHLHEGISGARALNVDETGWRTTEQRRALWGAFTPRYALFRVAPDRHEDRAKDLLAHTAAIVTSDRWWAYAHLPLSRRQICWSHLRRDFTAHAEGLAAEKEFGELGLELSEEVFWAWEVFCHTGDRRELQATVRRLQRSYKPRIRAYAAKRARNKRCRGMARNVLKLWPALWTFARVGGVEPTNNHAERSLRGAVIYRKLSLGSQSEDGERRISRLLSAHVTCRLQRRSLFEYLTELFAAHTRGDPVPLLS